MKNHQKGFGLVILIVIVAVLAVASGGVYVAVKQKPQISSTPETTATPAQTDNQASSQKEIPASTTKTVVQVSRSSICCQGRRVCIGN